MVGASAWVMTFTAWTFTGGAGEVYRAGTFFLILIFGNLVGNLVTFAIGPWFRQMRVITGIEAVFQRFGRSNEQFFTWIPVPFGILFGGIGLYAIGIFMAVVFNIDVYFVIVGLGLIVTVMCMLYDGFIGVLAVLPNPMWGRMCFVFCGACIGGLGVVLWLIGRRGGGGVADPPAG